MMKPFQLEHVPLLGMNLIEASAGTGKTFNIVHLFLRLLLEPRRADLPPLPVQHILVVTYTIAATQELKDRIRKELQRFLADFKKAEVSRANPLVSFYLQKFNTKEAVQEALKRVQIAVSQLEDLQVFTIHSFCRRMLKDYAFETGFNLKAELSTGEALLEEVVSDFWRKRFYHASEFLVQQMMDKDFSEKKILTRTQMLSFCKRYLDFPGLKIKAPQDSPPSPEREKEYREALQGLAVLWKKEKEKILEKLISDQGLNRSRYRETSIKRWYQQVDQYFTEEASHRSLLPFPPALHYFRQEHLSLCVKKNKVPPFHPFFQQVDSVWLQFSENLGSWEQWYLHLIQDLLEFCKQELTQRKKNTNVFFFQDLLQQLATTLRDPAKSEVKQAIQKRYAAALIDEFQDTDPLQWEIFKTLFQKEPHTLFLIGDPKQAIYRFRGADLRTYSTAQKQVQTSASGNCYTLRQNFRSEPQLLEGLNYLFTRPGSPLEQAAFLEKEIVFERLEACQKETRLHFDPPLSFEGQKPLQLWLADNSACGLAEDSKPNKGRIRLRIAEAVASEILKIHEAQPTVATEALSFSDFSILVRTHSQGTLMQEVLQEHGIPAVIKYVGNVFHSEEAQELHYILQAILEPNHFKRLQTAYATTLFGKESQELFETQSEEKRLEQRLLTLQEYHEVWKTQGIMSLMKRLMIQEKIQIHLLQAPQGKRRLTNFLHLMELIHEASINKKLNMDQLVSWFGKQRHEKELWESAYHLRKTGEESAVQIVTIHASKGLEYPIVFCPFAWEDILVPRGEALYCDEQEQQCLALFANQTSEQEKALKELISEDLRLLYVALTRAIYRCYLVLRFHETEQKRPALYSLFGENFSPFQNHPSLHLHPLPPPLKKHYEKKSSQDSPSPAGVFHPFEKKIPSGWKVASFSFLTKTKSQNEGDWSPLVPVEESFSSEKAEPEEIPKGFFAFPRGERAGQCIHEILAELDFTKDLCDTGFRCAQTLIPLKLQRYGYTAQQQEEYRPYLLEMLEQILYTPLSREDPSLFLAQIPWKHRLNELEFYFPLKTLSKTKLQEFFKTQQLDSSSLFELSWLEQLEKLDFAPCSGFFKGYIDLIFFYRDRYYLIDWKSNHLGNRAEAYHPRYLKSSMDNNFYSLQYHFYLVALHLYLQQRLPHYRYSKSCGGVYYLYLRGIHQGLGAPYGIFFERPPAERIEALSTLLTSSS
jgi:exodeoxyribonuclease V beta subunit